MEPNTVAVPDLSGMTLGEAQTALGSRVASTLGSQTQEANADDRGRGRDHQSEPGGRRAGGERVRVVDVVVSTGPEKVTVPDVSTGCLSMGAARKALKDAGLEAEVGDPQPSVPDCPNAEHASSARSRRREPPWMPVRW